MNALVLFDTRYGWTETVAFAIAEGLGSADDVQVKHVRAARASDLRDADLVVLGTPATADGLPSPRMREFLRRGTADEWRGRRLAAFDTRVGAALANAGDAIAQRLAAWGAALVGPAERFPPAPHEDAREAELARARAWGTALATRPLAAAR